MITGYSSESQDLSIQGVNLNYLTSFSRTRVRGSKDNYMKPARLYILPYVLIASESYLLCLFVRRKSLRPCFVAKAPFGCPIQMTASTGEKAIFTAETVAPVNGSIATKQGLSH